MSVSNSCPTSAVKVWLMQQIIEQGALALRQTIAEATDELSRINATKPNGSFNVSAHLPSTLSSHSKQLTTAPTSLVTIPPMQAPARKKRKLSSYSKATFKVIDLTGDEVVDRSPKRNRRWRQEEKAFLLPFLLDETLDWPDLANIVDAFMTYQQQMVATGEWPAGTERERSAVERQVDNMFNDSPERIASLPLVSSYTDNICHDKHCAVHTQYRQSACANKMRTSTHHEMTAYSACYCRARVLQLASAAS